jgi:hypothetical protein
MGLNREALEGGVHLAHVRATKKKLMLVQVAIVLLAVILLTALGGEIQVKPFYFNIGSILYFIILMALIVGVEGFFFRYLELKHMKSQSAKSYMLKTSIYRSLIIIAISSAVLIIVVAPFLANAVANFSSETGTTTTAAPFNNRDPLGLTTVDRIWLESAANAEVIIISDANYQTYKGDAEQLRQYAVMTTKESSAGVELQFPQTPFGMYYIVVDPDNPMEVSYTVHRTPSPTFVAFVTLFALAFIAAYAGWVAFAFQTRKQFTKGAIYK